MQAALTVRPVFVAKKATQARASAARKPVVCKAAMSVEKKAAAAFTTAATTLAASPAFALVDDRLNGDGAGLVLGVNDPILSIPLILVAGSVWAAYYFGSKNDGIAAGGRDDDSGLSL